MEQEGTPAAPPEDWRLDPNGKIEDMLTGEILENYEVVTTRQGNALLRRKGLG
jgi:hypothetical protein